MVISGVSLAAVLLTGSRRKDDTVSMSQKPRRASYTIDPVREKSGKTWAFVRGMSRVCEVTPARHRSHFLISLSHETPARSLGSLWSDVGRSFESAQRKLAIEPAFKLGMGKFAAEYGREGEVLLKPRRARLRDDLQRLVTAQVRKRTIGTPRESRSSDDGGLGTVG